MGSRIRRCIECGRCSTRYLVGFSPYSNGSLLLSNLCADSEMYLLYCICGGRSAPTHGKELKSYLVTKGAYERGYGSENEIVVVPLRARLI